MAESLPCSPLGSSYALTGLLLRRCMETKPNVIPGQNVTTFSIVLEADPVPYMGAWNGSGQLPALRTLPPCYTHRGLPMRAEIHTGRVERVGKRRGQVERCTSSLISPCTRNIAWGSIILYTKPCPPQTQGPAAAGGGGSGSTAQVKPGYQGAAGPTRITAPVEAQAWPPRDPWGSAGLGDIHVSDQDVGNCA